MQHRDPPIPPPHPAPNKGRGAKEEEEEEEEEERGGGRGAAGGGFASPPAALTLLMESVEEKECSLSRSLHPASHLPLRPPSLARRVRWPPLITPPPLSSPPPPPLPLTPLAECQRAESPGGE